MSLGPMVGSARTDGRFYLTPQRGTGLTEGGLLDAGHKKTP
jgi:hypothetical protein